MSHPETANPKRYGPYCPLARALDVVGDRWTILILREFLGRPAPFQDLHDGLPGIPENLLTAGGVDSNPTARVRPYGHLG